VKKKKWYLGRELLELKEWTATELLNYTKAGLPAYDELGRRILDLDTLPRKKQQTYKEIEGLLRSKWVGSTPSIGGGVLNGKRGVVPESSKEGFSLLCKKVYDSQPDLPAIPSGCEAISFILPADNAEAIKLLEKVKLFHYTYQDVIGFEQSKGPNMEGQENHHLPLVQGQSAQGIPAKKTKRESTRTKALKEIGRKGGSKSKKNTVLIAAIRKTRDGQDLLDSIETVLSGSPLRFIPRSSFSAS
jgi:hypothetical protein